MYVVFHRRLTFVDKLVECLPEKLGCVFVCFVNLSAARCALKQVTSAICVFFLLRKVHYHPISRRSSTTGHNASPVDLQLSWLEAVCIHCEPVAIRHLVGGRPKLQKKKLACIFICT